MRKFDDRKTSRERGYHTAWTKLSRMHRQRYPLCQRCQARGITAPADLVHHRDHNPANNRFSNLESICNSCHAQHHAPDRGEVKPTIGLDGMPIAGHPWTNLGERLVALREKAIANGMQLLTENQVLENVRLNRS